MIMALVDLRILKAEQRAKAIAEDKASKLSVRKEKLSALKRQVELLEEALKQEEKENESREEA